jgi:PAS domain S-box-containing protein
MESKLDNINRQLEQRLEAKALFMSIGDGAIVTDEKARISRVNKAALKILGYREKDLLGQWFPEKIIAEDEKGNTFSSIERPIGQVFLTGKAINSRAYYRRKNGSRIAVSLTVSPVLRRGKPIGAIEVFRDISREISLEKAKDEFVAIASHQLRTPATAVKQYVGLLLEGYTDPLTDNQKLFLKRAYENNERQLQIVQEILKITQLDLDKLILKPAVHDIRAIIQSSITSLSAVFKSKKQRITASLPAEPLLIKVDSEQIQSVMENLLENASNYSHEGTKITVSCAGIKDRVRIIVKDQGVGIDPADFPKLFQKFSRIPNPLSFNVSGTGLGLYWASKIIELHGGQISIKSEAGQGSSFILSLPNGL